MMILPRPTELASLQRLLGHFPVVAVLGARQVGKTTLARQLATSQPSSWFDLENPSDLARLADPLLALQGLRGLVVLDEIQRLPDIFPLLRSLSDRPERPATFLVLGSASPDLLRQSSESLAGRIAYHELGGLALDETGPEASGRLWLRGGFPRSFLAASDPESAEWRGQFIRTFLERDLPQLGISVPAPVLRRFWTMLAHWHGQVWNAAEFARSFGLSDSTVRRYLDQLSAALVIRQLPPWHEDIAKRQVKSPKINVADSGLLHSLLGLLAEEDLLAHPKLGASWEGFVMEGLRRRLGARRDECWFWATHSGAELDLLVVRGRTRLGFEIKRTSTPRLTRSLLSAKETLRLDQAFLVHAGEHSFSLADGVQALAFSRLQDDLPSM